MEKEPNIILYGFPNNQKTVSVYKDLTLSLLSFYNVPVSKIRLFFERWKVQKEADLKDLKTKDVDMSNNPIWMNDCFKTSFRNKRPDGTFDLEVYLNYNLLNPSSFSSMIAFLQTILSICFFYQTTNKNLDEFSSLLLEKKELVPLHHYMITYCSYDTLIQYLTSKHMEAEMIFSIQEERDCLTDILKSSFSKMLTVKGTISTKYFNYNLLQTIAFLYAVSKNTKYLDFNSFNDSFTAYPIITKRLEPYKKELHTLLTETFPNGINDFADEKFQKDFYKLFKKERIKNDLILLSAIFHKNLLQNCIDEEKKRSIQKIYSENHVEKIL